MRDSALHLYRSWRRLRRAPAFSIAVILSLSLGFSALLMSYTFFDGVLLRPLPFPDPARLVAIDLLGSGSDPNAGTQSEASYAFYRNNNHSFQEVAAYLENVVSLSDLGQPEQVSVALVSWTLFPLLGTQPLHGRSFSESEDGPSGSDVVLISYDLWTRRYGKDPAVIGKVVELNRAPKKVIGIMPPHFDFPRSATDVWYPLGADLALPDSNSWSLKVVARLARTVTIASARADLQRLVPSLREAYPTAPPLDPNSQTTVNVLPLKNSITRNTRTTALVFLFVASSILLLVVANLANLFLVRAEHRKPETTVKRALGASSWIVAADFLTESFLLVSAAMALALMLTALGIHWSSRLGLDQIPTSASIEVNAGEFLVAALLTFLVAMFFGFISYLRTQRTDLGLNLRSGTSRAVGGNERIQNFAIVIQVSITLILLFGAIEVLRTFSRLQSIPLGFEPTGVLVADVSLPYGPYPDFDSEQHFFARLKLALAQTYGISKVDATSTLPFGNSPSDFRTRIVSNDAISLSKSDGQLGTMTLVTAGYFDTLRIPLLRGRTFDAGDATSDLHPVILSQGLALKVFGTVESAGKTLRMSSTPTSARFTVVGVAGDVPSEHPDRSASPNIYFPLVDTNGRPASVPILSKNFSIVLRSSFPVFVVASSIRNAMKSIDPKLPLTRMQSMNGVVRDSTAQLHSELVVLTTTGSIAFVLGILGIYAVTAYGVSQRIREFGLRIALGAQSKDVLTSVIGQTTRVVLLGTIIGAFGALLLTRSVEGFFPGINPMDPLSLSLLMVGFLICASLASYLPARRATGVDVMQALRNE